MRVELFLYLFLIDLFLAIVIYQLGGRRGLYSLLGHLAVLEVIPAILGRLSIIYVSIPMLAMYYFVIYRTAEILIPFANPDDQEEVKKHFWVLFWYSWGLQYPQWVVADHAGQNIEQRVYGRFTKRYGAPGIIWSRSHHAVGISNGFQFSRVAGPGIVFTNRFERPDKIIDLRTQIRSSEIQVLTKDGVSFNATIVLVFAVDKENWSAELYDNLCKANPMLKGAATLDNIVGSYPFSSKRVRTVIKMGGVSNSLTNTNSYEIIWYDRLMGQVEMIARQVLAQRNLSELWNPRNSNKNSSAMAEISEEVMNKAFIFLQKQAIRLYAIRIVNYGFPISSGSNEDEISKQQLETWSTHWAEKAFRTLVDAESKAALEMEKVRANTAEAQFTMFEEITKKSHADSNFARKMIAWLLLSSLGDFAKYAPEPSQDKPTKTLDDIIKSKINKRISEMFPDKFLQMRALLLKGGTSES